jgi:hypothetical protein
MFSVNELKKDQKKEENVRNVDEINSEQEQDTTANVIDINIDDSNCLPDI